MTVQVQHNKHLSAHNMYDKKCKYCSLLIVTHPETKLNNIKDKLVLILQYLFTKVRSLTTQSTNQLKLAEN